MSAMSSPSFRWSTIVLAMLSLSIGWGIRGQFGHETGAAMPGMLCAVAVCLFSGREDWRARVPFFALFGALGWGFGGSIAYMYVMSYSQSGHLPTQIYGYISVFVTGFLWAAMGGAGTAYPACEERERLTATFKPLCWIFALWTVQYFFMEPFTVWYGNHMHLALPENSDFRQKDPFYWLDSEWIEASFALAALCLFDLWDRRSETMRLWLIVPFAIAGAGVGCIVKYLLEITNLMLKLLHAVVQLQWDPTAINPKTGAPFDPHNMVTNWPQVFFDFAPHLGWIFGMVLGIAVYFCAYGKWRSGSSLLLHITLGSYIFFILGPVLLSNLMPGVGGFRMMPPRGDSWANTVGAFLGMLVYMYRYKLKPVAMASIVAGVIGGLGYMTAEIIKVLAMVPGNPVLTQDQSVIQAWAHWRSANWHSICTEQGVGLFYGLAIAIAMGFVAKYQKPVSNEPRTGRWTEAFCVFFILNVLFYVNVVKNIEDWTKSRSGGYRAVPELMKSPLFDSIEFSARIWFDIMFLAFTVLTVALLVRHLHRPLNLVPRSWLGKGQLFYLLFLWFIVIANFEKELVAFTAQRIATEGVIFINALIATFMILHFPRDTDEVPDAVEDESNGTTWKAVMIGAVGLAICTFAYTGIARSIYGNKPDGPGFQLRFGPDANWRTHPTQKDTSHA